nr:diacylglycerol O-acyltransferase 2 isoform X2 [Loxodonta africana]XP_023394684.1 diacylglycerol O-acyltransferase 2 isoform X2 [Loxodonta africana]
MGHMKHECPTLCNVRFIPCPSRCPCRGKASGELGTGSSILSALQDLFSITWLNRSKVEKQLQIFSVLQWVLTFLMLGMAGSIIFMYTFCTDCWLISVLYFTWLVFDWNTPKKGGRRSEWVRNWAVWRYFRDYFPVQLVKTHNLLTTRNYILGSHPHGIMGLGIFCNFGTEATEVSKKFAGIRPYLATLAGNFRMPVLREYLMSGVGEPITIPKVEQPTQKDIDLYHSMYMEALVKLFDNYKTKFGLPETEVLEVN